MKIIHGHQLEFTPASHEDSNDPGCLKKVLATKSDMISGQVQMVNWSKMPVGKSFRLHFHEDLQECFVIVEGQVRIEVNGEFEEAKAGDAILIDPMEKHRMTNIGETEVQYIVFGIASGKNGKTVVVE